MLQNIGPYRVQEVLGRGGMAVVYRGEHERTGAQVAIKRVARVAMPFVASIRRELHALARVSHPGVVAIVDHGMLDGLPWYAMELLSGRTLRALYEERGETRPIELLAPLCEPLAILHAAGIVHGDLKPENVIVTPDRGPVVVDFGIAASFAGAGGREHLAAMVDTAGTPAYMSPEQIRGEPLDARSDLYALGCMLYECVLGRPPFIGTAAEILDQHLHAAPKAPSLWGAPVSRELESLIFRLLAKRASDRVGYAEDVAAILRGLGIAGAPAPGVGAHGSSAGAPDAAPAPRTGAPVARERSTPYPTYLYRSDIIGRDEHLRRADAALDALAQSRRGGAVFIVGESGVGKTRLGIEIARRAEQRGMTVVAGHGRSPSEADAPPLHPFAPLVSEAVDRGRAGGEAAHAPSWDERTAVLAPYFADLAAHVSGAPELPQLPLDAARARVLDAMSDLASEVAAAAPLVLVLDDVQWADELSLALLGRFDLAAQAERGILCVALVRVEGIERVEPVMRTMNAPRWDLERLGREDVAAMVAGMLAVPFVPRTWVDYLVDASAGNPFFLTEYLRAAASAGLLSRRGDGRWSLQPLEEAPDDPIAPSPAIEAIIARRIEGLAPDERGLLAAAAVLGRVFAGEVAALTADLDLRAALDALVVLETRQILEEAPRGELRFVHDRIHQVAYAQLSNDARRALHGRAANAIAALHPSDPTVHAPLGRHYAGAGEHARAGHHYRAAAQHAESIYANEQALALYHAAVEQAGAGDADPALLADLWTCIGEMEQRAGRATAAHAAYARALANEGPPSRAQRAALHRRQGSTWELRHDHRAALACYAEAERCLGEAPEDPDPSATAWWREWVQLEIERISIHYWAADLEALDAVVERLGPVVDRRGSAAQRARFFASLVQRNVRRERYRPSPSTVTFARRCLDAFAETEDRVLTATARFTLGAVLLWCDELAPAEVCLTAALDEAEQMRSLPLQCRCLAYLTVLCRRQRDPDATRGMAWQCQSIATSTQMTEYVGIAQSNLGWVHLQEGSLDEAEALCRAALTAWRGLALAHPFEWLARLPLLALEIPDDEARQHARALLAPSQQCLPAALEATLVRVAERGRDLAGEALAVGEQLGFV
ncbi:protein kinase domain-containing protein [Pendulispora albinea]|uniref:AAA family ATPase n=1 Tax=Pendulispora albinea TaxID=2741071 RepID=A0ABZ2LZ71_9BACT